MNNNRLWSQNSQRHTYNVFVFTFITHLFKRKDVLHTGCLVEKVINLESYRIFWNFKSFQATNTSTGFMHQWASG